jgi:hypothetical protein
MTYEKDGTSIYDNANALLDEELKVTLITANPTVFHKEMQDKLKTKQALFKRLAEFQKKKPKKRKQIKLFKQFVNKGGAFRIEIPSLSHIKKAIDQKRPVLALLYGRALGSKEGGFHFVVVSGYKKDAVYINNPLPKARGGWFSAPDFIYALHASTCFDMDNGSLLIVGK